MITGLSGLDLSTLVGAFRRSRGGQPPARGLQPVPGLDTVRFSGRANSLAGAGEAGSFASQQQNFRNAVARGSAAENGVADRGAVNPAGALASPAVATYQAVQSVSARPAANDSVQATRPAEQASMMERMKASFLTRKGDARYDAAMDLNADGAINHADLAAMRDAEKPGGPQELLGQMRNALFSGAGDSRFNAAADANGDGAVNFADLAMLRAKIDSAASNTRPGQGAPAAPPQGAAELDPVVAQARVNPDQGTPGVPESVRNAFFSSNGDDAFAAAADLNGDGQVNFADLAELGQRNQQG